MPGALSCMGNAKVLYPYYACAVWIKRHQSVSPLMNFESNLYTWHGRGYMVVQNSPTVTWRFSPLPCCSSWACSQQCVAIYTSTLPSTRMMRARRCTSLYCSLSVPNIMDQGRWQVCKWRWTESTATPLCYQATVYTTRSQIHR